MMKYYNITSYINSYVANVFHVWNSSEEKSNCYNHPRLSKQHRECHENFKILPDLLWSCCILLSQRRLVMHGAAPIMQYMAASTQSTRWVSRSKFTYEQNYTYWRHQECAFDKNSITWPTSSAPTARNPKWAWLVEHTPEVKHAKGHCRSEGERTLWCNDNGWTKTTQQLNTDNRSKLRKWQL